MSWKPYFYWFYQVFNEGLTITRLNNTKTEGKQQYKWTKNRLDKTKYFYDDKSKKHRVMYRKTAHYLNNRLWESIRFLLRRNDIIGICTNLLADPYIVKPIDTSLTSW